jgi:hypothetical protein
MAPIALWLIKLKFCLQVVLILLHVVGLAYLPASCPADSLLTLSPSVLTLHPSLNWKHLASLREDPPLLRFLIKADKFTLGQKLIVQVPLSVPTLMEYREIFD